MTRLLLFIAIALPCAGQIDEARLLRAIASVESNNNPAAVGRAGETTQWQMTQAMRRHYGSALAFLCSLEHDLPRVGMDGTDPYVLALGFHCGLTRLARRQITDADAEYAGRVINLYNHD